MTTTEMRMKETYLDSSTNLAQFSSCFKDRHLSTSETQCNCCCQATDSGATEPDMKFLIWLQMMLVS